MSKTHPPELKRYMDKEMDLKLNGNRCVSGVLRGFDPFMNMVIEIQKVLDDVDKQLHQEGSITNVLSTIEQKTGIKRLHIVLGIVAVQALYLVFGHFAQLVCNFMGFIYPAYVSVKAIESANKDDDTQWLTYWVSLDNFWCFRVVFAVLSVVEFFSHQIMSVFPVYWLFKSLFLLYLYLPSTLGATKLYHKYQLEMSCMRSILIWIKYEGNFDCYSLFFGYFTCGFFIHKQNSLMHMCKKLVNLKKMNESSAMERIEFAFATAEREFRVARLLNVRGRCFMITF
uniref:Receptor expression-enhancing protein n=1 Tax=Heterorhabditis bacteriophora TaxID=37862 RepID=A0A1I7XHV3_HETBA